MNSLLSTRPFQFSKSSGWSEALAAQRQKRRIEASQGSWKAENEKCAAGVDGCLYWIQTYLWIYDPRPSDGSPRYLPFKLWPKQVDCVKWLIGQIDRNDEGLIEKSRDVGASYLCLAVALWKWRYSPGFKATFGSNLERNVDEVGNMDSLFEKLRAMMRRLPPEMLPPGFEFSRHSRSMKLLNPDSGASITGDSGEEIGRSGRSTVIFIDEAAHIEHAERIEKSLSANTDCVIWVSSVNGMGNLFARKRHSILKGHQIFRLHWRDDPRKTEEWAKAKEASFSDPTTWASEYDIDYSASVTGICVPALWVESCKRLLALEPRLKASNSAVIGLDVGAGKAKSVAVPRKGPVVKPPESRTDPDTTETAHWGIEVAKKNGASQLNFDAPGVGFGVSSTLMHNPTKGLLVLAVNTGLPPTQNIWPDGRTSEEMFGNLKAELWWMVRTAAQRSHEHVLFLEQRKGGQDHSADLTDLLALPSGDPESDTLCLQLSLVKWGKDERGKIVIEKKAALAARGIQSPDYADALVLTEYEAVNPPMEISDELLRSLRAGAGRRH